MAKKANGKPGLLSKNDNDYLRGLVTDVLENARLYPGHQNNHTRIILIRPGGDYPSFWIRDYAMSLESGLIGQKEQRSMLEFTATAQSDRTWITGGGGLVPMGAIADHIRPEDGLPIFYPGTYNYEEQGGGIWGKTPPYDDQFYFIQLAYYYVTKYKDRELLRQRIGGMRLIDRLELAFFVPPSHGDNEIVYTTDAFRGVDFGFRDAEQLTGDLCFPSILKYHAAGQLAELWGLLGEKKKAGSYRAIGEKIKTALPRLFADDRGMLRASTGKSRQADVWSTALAVYYGMLSGHDLVAASTILAEAYKKGILAYKGNIRHILTTDDFNESTAWEYSGASKNTYQNGAYWGTPLGWVCYAIAKTDTLSAKKLAREYIDDLRATDFRKGVGFGGPYECFYPPDYKQNPVYLTTVSAPYGVFRTILSFGKPALSDKSSY